MLNGVIRVHVHKKCGISDNQLLRTNFTRRSNFVLHTGTQKEFPRLITSTPPSSSYVLPTIAFPQIPFQKSSHFIHMSICNGRCRQWLTLWANRHRSNNIARWNRGTSSTYVLIFIRLLSVAPTPLCSAQKSKFMEMRPVGTELFHVDIHTYVHTYSRTYIHTHTHTYIHTHIRTYIHTYITYIHTHIQTDERDNVNSGFGQFC